MGSLGQATLLLDRRSPTPYSPFPIPVFYLLIF
jgi:hypothetical protein